MNALARLAIFAVGGTLLLSGMVWLIQDPAAAPGTTNAGEGNGVSAAATGAGNAASLRVWHSSKDCKACHEKTYAEWMGSHHQIAYTNPRVRRLSEDFRQSECKACHLPRPVAVTGFANRTLPRRTRPEEGVDCLACHLGADGRIMGVRSNPDAPCAPRADADFASPRLCASCHNQHQTTDQWEASSYAAEGITCNTCHMVGGSHVFPGAHDPDMLARASRYTAAIVDGKLRMTLHNHGAGHNFPTEERHRAVDIQYRFVGVDDRPGEWQRAYRFRQPYRDEPNADQNTQLPAGAEHSVDVDIPPGTRRIDTQVWYRLNPYAKDGDEDSTLLFEKSLTP
jgi:hypothetical protein